MILYSDNVYGIDAVSVGDPVTSEGTVIGKIVGVDESFIKYEIEDDYADNLIQGRGTFALSIRQPQKSIIITGEL